MTAIARNKVQLRFTNQNSDLHFIKMFIRSSTLTVSGYSLHKLAYILI